MKRSEYNSLLSSFDWHHSDHIDINVAAGKPNGNTYLDIGGSGDAVVLDEGVTIVIEFETEDGTKGQLCMPKSAFEDLLG